MLSGFWVKLLSDFLIAISWQLTVVIALLIFKKEIRGIINAIAERGFKGEVGPVKAEIPPIYNIPEAKEKVILIDQDQQTN